MKGNAKAYEEHKKKEAERLRKYRTEKKKNANETSDNNVPNQSAFMTPQSFGKAVKRARKQLPESPRKKKAVLRKLVEEVGLPASETPTKQKTGPKVNEELNKKVSDFYNSDDISWQAPGRKDRVIYRSRNEYGKKQKEYVQSRYMLMSLGEAHELAIKEGISISRSKFCSLRPKHIKLMEERPHNVCVCVTHENVRMLLEVLKDHTDLPGCLTKFTDQLVCDSSSKKCMTLQCDLCKHKLSTCKPQGDACEVTVKYCQWQGTGNDMQKVTVEETVSTAFDELQRQLSAFLIHVYVKRQQKHFFDTQKSKVDGKRCVLHVDFSENATLKGQDEPQSAHWTHSQAGLFTAYIWVSKQSEESHIVVTDDVHHTKDQVWTFMSSLLEDITRHLNIEVMDVFSDGTSTQFKQKYLFSNLAKWESTFGIKVNWHFFATSHGKGIIDGIGGTVKRSVWRAVRSGNAEASSPYQFYEVAVLRNKNVRFHYISADKVKEESERMRPYWDSVLGVTGTRQVHSVRSRGHRTVLVAQVSTAKKFRAEVFLDDESSDSNISSRSSDEMSEDDSVESVDAAGDISVREASKNINPNDHKVGDFIGVEYASEKKSKKIFIAQVTNIDEDETLLEVINMRRCGRTNMFVFRPEDKCWVDGKTQVKFKLDQPTVDQRERYSFSNLPDIVP